jgi:hypothetical protein
LGGKAAEERKALVKVTGEEEGVWHFLLAPVYTLPDTTHGQPSKERILVRCGPHSQSTPTPLSTEGDS